MLAALIIEILAALALAVFGWMGLLEKIPPNRIAGIRTRFTLASERNWYVTHRAGGALMLLGGAPSLAIGLAFLPFAAAGKIDDTIVLVVVATQIGIILITSLAAWWYGTTIARHTSGSV
jgi:uncharacterized membrane protein